MSVRSAHGVSLDEISRFDFIFSLPYFSIAENSLQNKLKVMSPFLHEHEEYEFIVPLTTIPLLRYAQANYIGEVGFIYPVNPFTEHGIEVDLHSKVISITVDREFADKLKAELGFDGQYFYTRFIYKWSFVELVKQFEAEYKNQSPKVDALAREIVSELIKNGLKSGEDNRRPEKKYVKNMRNVLLYIEENYQNPDLTIAGLAKYAGYSQAYFTKAFVSYMSDTPIMHLNKRRISDAKMLLQNEKLPLMEIAKKCGYKNLSTFTEAFKRVMGMLPSEYRKKYL